MDLGSFKICDWNKSEIIDDCMSQLETDFMPLHDVYRSIYGFNNITPTQLELRQTLDLISFLLNEKNVITVFGPDMKPSGNSIIADLEKIKQVLANEKYEDYNYGIWFELV